MTNNEIQMSPVESGTIAKIGFSESKLYVTFHTGNSYEYSNVSQDEFISIKEAKSIGSKLKEVVKLKSYKKL